MTSQTALSESAIGDSVQRNAPMTIDAGPLMRVSAARDLIALRRCGSPCIIENDQGDSLSLNVVFDAPWVQPHAGRMETELQGPVIRCRLQDVEGAGRGNVVRVYDDKIQTSQQENTFEIVSDIEDDGTGWTTIQLRELSE